MYKQLDAPLYSALLELSRGPGLRFHMPGHKGVPLGTSFDGVFAIDYTEIPPTGNLYGQGGPIQRAEELAAGYYSMERCFFLTCGATQGIKAAIASFCGHGAAIVLDRNCHMSAIDSCVQLDLDPTFVSPAFDASTGTSGDICPRDLADALGRSGAKAAMVTSPTYYGALLDIEALARAAHSVGAALIVDCAHGSHLRACGVHDPAAAGADAVIFSAHKTLAAMGQGAYLLMRGRDEAFYERARGYTALFGTTSPSYPIMASLDMARAMLEQYPVDYMSAVALCKKAAEDIVAKTPFRVLSPGEGTDPCRLTVSTIFGGISGDQAAQALRHMDIEPEMSDRGSVVFIVTPADGSEKLSVLVNALFALKGNPQPPPPFASPPVPKRALGPREAYFSPSCPVPLGKAKGKISARAVSPYPPGVAAIVPGEVVDDIFIEYLLEKGYNVCDNLFCLREEST